MLDWQVQIVFFYYLLKVSMRLIVVPKTTKKLNVRRIKIGKFGTLVITKVNRNFFSFQSHGKKLTVSRKTAKFKSLAWETITPLRLDFY